MIRIAAAAAPDRARTFGRVRFVALLVLGLLVAHDAIYGMQALLLGPAGGLPDAVHGYWPAFTVLAVLLALTAAAGAVSVIAHLRGALGGLTRAAGHARAAEKDSDNPVTRLPRYIDALRSLFPRLFAAITLAFIVQENVEAIAAAMDAPGLFVLGGPGYALTVPVLAGVSLLLAAAGAWVRWHTAVLAHLIATARAATRRPVAAVRPPARWGLVAALVAHRWILLRSDAGRAPPAAAGA